MKKHVAKISSIIIAAAMAMSLTACSENKENSADGGSAESAVTESAVIEHDEMRVMSSAELIKEIKIGWSLGNTLDSTGSGGAAAETSWGNPVTTKEMITAVKDAGFNAIRVPISWGQHMDADNKVEDVWMDRVQEVVDYAYGQDMYVILNIHHEDWHDPYYDNAEAAKTKLAALWTQIGTRFADYDERLIFEGMNEPRKRNTAMEWNGGDAEGHDVVNQLNATFVETIRSLGGNNANRHLMVPTYAANSSLNTMKALVVPDDDKVIVSIHAYLPYGFALGGDIQQRDFAAGEGNASEIINLMANIKSTFLDNGIPVIIGETGARNKANEAARAVWATYYISQAKEIGVPCFIWDNNAFSGNGENFGLLNRLTCTWKYPEIISGFMAGLE